MTATDSRRHVALTFRTNLVLGVLQVASGILLARLLGPALRGELAAVQLWGLTLGTFAALGVPEAVVYFVARRKDEAGTTASSAVVLTFLTSLGFLAAGWFIVPVALEAQTQDVKDLARMFLLVLPVYVVAGSPMSALRGLNSFTLWNRLRILPTALWLIVVSGMWLTGSLRVGTLAFGFVVAQFVVLVVILATAVDTVGGPFRVRPGRWGALLRFGLPSAFGYAPQMANQRLDQLLIANRFPAESGLLGLYVVGVAWASVLAPLLSALGSVLFPRIAGEASAEERLRIMLKGFRVSAIVAGTAAAGVMAITYPGIRLLFGSDYSAAVPAALILVAAGGMLAVGMVVQEGFRGLGRPSEVLWSELAGLVSTVVFLLALLDPLGIVGAAIASVAGYTTTVVVLLVRLRRFAGRPMAAELVPRRADVHDVVQSVAGMVRRTRR